MSAKDQRKSGISIHPLHSGYEEKKTEYIKAMIAHGNLHYMPDIIEIDPEKKEHDNHYSEECASRIIVIDNGSDVTTEE